jgi:hypothetical protein
MGWRPYNLYKILILRIYVLCLLGLGHIMKGKLEFGNPIYEYEYIDQYIKRSELGLLLLDLKIIWRGVILILKGGGH